MKTFAIIKKHDGWTKVPADDIEILGFKLKIHKSLKSENTWSVSSPEKGLALVTGAKSRKLAANETRLRILCHGTDKIQRFIAREQDAPADAPLHVWETPTVAKADTDFVAAIIADRIGAERDGEEHQAIRRALCSRGKNAGRLLGKCPSLWDDKLACAAWLGIQPNPHKVSIGRLFFLKDEALTLFQKLQTKRWPLWLDPDADALDKLGVW